MSIPPTVFRKLGFTNATWHTYQLGERVLTLTVVKRHVHPTQPRHRGQITQPSPQGYDIHLGGDPGTGTFGSYQFTHPTAPTEAQLTYWANFYLTNP